MTTTSATGGLLVKFDSSGNVQWQKIFSDTSITGGFTCNGVKPIIVDSSENVYVTGTFTGNTVCTFKFDSSGTLLWARQYSWSIFSIYPYPSLSIDGSGNVYVCFMCSIGTGANASRVITLKYNSSGVIQWQRYWSTSSTFYYYFFNNLGACISVLLDGSLVYGASGNDTAGGYGYPTYFKVPPDGSHTGAYTVRSTTYTYAAGSGTDSSVSTSNVNNTYFPTWAAAGASSSTATSSASATFATTSTSTTI
jgi:hypothetical protein